MVFSVSLGLTWVTFASTFPLPYLYSTSSPFLTSAFFAMPASLDASRKSVAAMMFQANRW